MLNTLKKLQKNIKSLFMKVRENMIKAIVKNIILEIKVEKEKKENGFIV